MIGITAAVLERHGQHPRLVRGRAPEQLGLFEVLVAMRYAPINPADQLMISGDYPHSMGLPCTLGAEGVGEVVAVGREVHRFQVGDAVLPLARGNWCSHRLIGEHELTLAPPGLPPEQAAMLRINGSTAWRLISSTVLRPGDWVVQNGARSSVAHFVRLIARRRGIGVLNVIRGHGLEGVPWIIDGPELASRAGPELNGAPVRLGLDCVAGSSTGRIAECVDRGGKVMVFGHLSGQPCEIASTLLTSNLLTVEGFSLRLAEVAGGAAAIEDVISEVGHLLADDAAWLPVRAVYGLSELGAALQAARAPGGRVLLALDR